MALPGASKNVDPKISIFVGPLESGVKVAMYTVDEIFVKFEIDPFVSVTSASVKS